jgi:AmiR/NasT family two-component response regulator
MSRSYVKKDVNQVDIEMFMRDTKEKFFKISKSLFEHEQVLN